MTDEEQGSGFPDFPMPDFDWDRIEYAANNEGSTEGAPPPTMGDHVVLSEDMLAQRVAWDVAPHEYYEKVAGYLNLPVGSEEVIDKEHEEAHRRLNSVLMIAPPVDVLSRLSARTVLATMLVMNEQEDELLLDSEEFIDSAEKLEVVIFNAVLATVAELVDWGLLHTPHVLGTFGGNADTVEKVRAAIQKAVEEATKDIEGTNE